MSSRAATTFLLFVALACGVPACAKVNRFIYRANRVVDRVILRPVARGYEKVIPKTIRHGVSNFFDNLTYVNVILNDFLQGKFRQGTRDTARLVVNTTVGIGGILDVAKKMGLEEHDEDFGQTLGVWGMGPGPYFVLPLLGPTTVRDAPGILFGAATNPLYYVDERAITIPARVLSGIDQRSRAPVEEIDKAAVDPYVFTREAYLQRRRFKVYDGNPPTEDLSEELGEELEDILGEEEQEVPPAEQKPKKGTPGKAKKKRG